MKKKVKGLMAVAVMMMTAAMAQGQTGMTDMTGQLCNPNFDEGINGWSVEFTPPCIWKVEQNKREDREPAYFGFEQQALGIWNSSNAPVGDNALLQRVTNLPSGTYVFSAAIGAMIQGGEVENKDDVKGVYLVAGNEQVAVATNNVEARQAKVAHAWRYNVAADVDGNGSLTLGMRCLNTTATYIAFDQTTLHFYGDTPADEALRLERLYDLNIAVDLANELAQQTMNADSLSLLNDALDTAKDVKEIAAAEVAEEAIRLALLDARKSVNDYKNLASRLEEAKEVAAQEWSDQVADALEALKGFISEADALYAAATAERPAINALRSQLKDAMDRVKLDKLFDTIDALQSFLFGEVTDEECVILGLEPGFEHPGFGSEMGQIAESQADVIAAYCDEIQAAMDAIEDGTGTVSNALAYVDGAKTLISQCLKNVIGFDSFPITIGQEDGMPGETLMAGDNEYYHFESRTFHFAVPVSHLRLTVTNTLGCITSGCGYAQKNASGIPWFNIAELAFYDEEGLPIEVGEGDITYNYIQSGEGSVANMFDGDVTTYYHSLWSGDTKDYHYIEVALPENTYSFSFFLDNQAGGINHRSMDSPVEIVLTGITETASMLAAVISDAEDLCPRIGFGPGCVSENVSAFTNALNEAKALADNGGSDEAMIAAIEKLEAAEAVIDAYEPKPITNGTYTLTSAYSQFFENQGQHKAIYWNAEQDGFYWKSINAADAALMQFELTEVTSEVEGEQAFTLRNVGSGKYVTKYGESYYLLGSDDAAEAEVVYFEYLGKGAYRVHTAEVDEDGDFFGYFHTESHSAGKGKEGKVCQWYDGIESGSAWFIEQTTVLPIETLLQEGRSDCFHLFEPVECVLIHASGNVSFEDMTVTDASGNALPCTIETSASGATVTFSEPTDLFAFSLSGATDAGTVTISNGATRLSDLQKVVDATRALGLEEGPNVGDISDLSALNDALANADKLLANGGSDSEIDAVIDAINKAVEGVQYRMPEEGKQYFIVSAYDAYFDNQGIYMAVYDGNMDRPRWSYLNTENAIYRWQFIHQPDVPVLDDEGNATGEMTDGGYLIRNVGTGQYINTDGSQPVIGGEGAAYLIKILEGEVCNINYIGGGSLHTEGHSSGKGCYGQLCFYGGGVGTGSAWRILDAATLSTDIDVISAEPDTNCTYPTAIYDLFGRKVTDLQPNTIYIQGGKKFMNK